MPILAGARSKPLAQRRIALESVGPGCEWALAWIEGLSAGRAPCPCGSFRLKRTELKTDSRPASERPTPLRAAVKAA